MKLEVDYPDEYGPGTSTISPNGYHPAAVPAKEWYVNWMAQNPAAYLEFKEAIASLALSGNRLAEICLGTIERLETGQPVSDRYILGLAWMVREMEDGMGAGHPAE